MNLLTPLLQVYKLSIYTFLLSFLLDITICLPTTKKYMSKNTNLYIQNLHANIKNLFIISPFYYFLAYNILLDTSNKSFSLLNTYFLLLIQNIFYHYAHKYMHTIPNIRWIHDFHHNYIETTPTIGNAVTMSEFQIAYILPFLIGCFISHPSPLDLQTAIFIISSLNMFIHTQELKNLHYFYYLVSPKKHIGHHETRSGTYSAPLLDLDKIINRKKV